MKNSVFITFCLFIFGCGGELQTVIADKQIEVTPPIIWSETKPDGEDSSYALYPVYGLETVIDTIFQKETVFVAKKQKIGTAYLNKKDSTLQVSIQPPQIKVVYRDTTKLFTKIENKYSIWSIIGWTLFWFLFGWFLCYLITKFS